MDLFKKFKDLFIFVYEYFAYVYNMYALCPQKSKEGIKASGTGVMDGCEPPGRCWKLNLGLLQEQ